MTMKIQAAVAREHDKPLSVEELELDDLQPNEVRVRLVATGICHTDAIARDGVYPVPLPAVLGHEGAGIVEAVGGAVRNIGVGDHVVLSAAYCGVCKRCRLGQMAHCENLLSEDFGGRRRDGSTSLSKGGERISSHFFGQSSFATHANVVQESVVVVDKDAPLELMGPLGCGLQTGAGAVLNELRPEPGSSFVVFGTGAVGSAALMAAKIAGCTTAVAVDIHDSRLELAKQLGATHTFNSKRVDVSDELKKLTDGAGIDYAVDTTAIPAVLRQAAESLGIRGTLVLVGAAAPGTDVSFEIGASLVKGWTFKTAIQGGAVPQVFIPRLIELWKQGRFPFDKLVKHYALADIHAGFEASKDGTVVKPIVKLAA